MSKKDMLPSFFINSFKAVSNLAHKNAYAKGFWSHPNRAEKIALMHSELSEALEGIRLNNPPDDKIPEYSSLEAELADCVIRIMDFSDHYDLRVAEAIIEKMKFNETRPPKHGKNF